MCRKSGGGTAGGCLYVEERGCIILWGRVVERGCIFRKNEGWEENVGVCYVGGGGWGEDGVGVICGWWGGVDVICGWWGGERMV